MSPSSTPTSTPTPASNASSDADDSRLQAAATTPNASLNHKRRQSTGSALTRDISLSPASSDDGSNSSRARRRPSLFNNSTPPKTPPSYFRSALTGTTNDIIDTEQGPLAPQLPQLQGTTSTTNSNNNVNENNINNRNSSSNLIAQQQGSASTITEQQYPTFRRPSTASVTRISTSSSNASTHGRGGGPTSAPAGIPSEAYSPRLPSPAIRRASFALSPRATSPITGGSGSSFSSLNYASGELSANASAAASAASASTAAEAADLSGGAAAGGGGGGIISTAAAVAAAAAANAAAAAAGRRGSRGSMSSVSGLLPHELQHPQPQQSTRRSGPRCCFLFHYPTSILIIILFYLCNDLLVAWYALTESSQAKEIQESWMRGGASSAVPGSEVISRLADLRGLMTATLVVSVIDMIMCIFGLAGVDMESWKLFIVFVAWKTLQYMYTVATTAIGITMRGFFSASGKANKGRGGGASSSWVYISGFIVYILAQLYSLVFMYLFMIHLRKPRKSRR